MNRIIYTLLLLAASVSIASGQYLISSEFRGIVTKLELEQLFGQEFRTGVEKYKITYMTTGIHGEVDTASGLIVVPNTRIEGKLAVVAYQHGTTDGPHDVPSTEGSGLQEALAYGGMGYYVSATDYLGLGDHPGFHPYVHAGTEASAGLDMLIATSEFIEDQSGDPILDFLFVSGYSQGGHGAMALNQLLEESWSGVYPITASTPMSGPYSISEVMYDKMIGDEPYFFVSYPIYAILGYQEVYGNLYDSIQQVFRAPYITAIEAFYNRQVTLTQLTTFVFAKLIELHGLPLTRELFVPSYLEAAMADPDHPMRVALRESDTYDWTSSTPMRLLYCTADDQVPFRNTIVADSVLNANGSDDVKKMDMDPTADHGECAVPAILESIRFFDSFIISSSSDFITAVETNFAWPNPAQGQINVGLNRPGRYTYSIIDLEGRIVGQWDDDETSTQDVGRLESGLYILRADSETNSVFQKIVIH